MKLKFETFFRGLIILVAAMVFWATWSSAQETKSTNTTAAAKATNGATGTIPKIPNLLQKHEAWLTFGLDRVTFLQPELGGNPRWKYLASFLYIILAFYVSKFFDFLTRVWLKKLAAKTETKLDDLLLDLLNGPVKVVSFVIFLHIGLSIFSWPPTVEEIFSKGLNLIVVASFVYLLLKAIDLTMGYWKLRVSASDDKAFNDQLFPIIRKSLKIFVLIVAFLFICDNVFNYNIKTILASLSIGGLRSGWPRKTRSQIFLARSWFSWTNPFGSVIESN